MSNFVSYRARFQGKLAGVSVEELKGLDYEKEKLIDRMEEVLNKLDKVQPFFDEYFFQKENDDRDNGEFDHLITESDEREYYRYSPNTTDELSEDINICKYIQMYAGYILNSKDLPRERQQEYSILTEEEFEKQLKKEMATDFKADANVVLDCRPKNDYNNLTLRINKKDLYPNLQNNKYGVRDKDVELAVVLNGYETFKEYLKGELRKLQAGEYTKFNLIQLRSLLSSINDDMLLSKNMLLGIRSQAKRLGDENPMNDYSTLDYSNPEHIKAILKFCKITKSPRPDDMMSHIGYDMFVAIDTLKKNKRLDNIDLEIIECYNANYTLEDIGNEVGMKKQSVDYRIKKICEKIAGVI